MHGIGIGLAFATALGAVAYCYATPPTFALTSAWARSFAGVRMKWLQDAATNFFYPETYRHAHACSTGVKYRGPHMYRGIIVFLHGVGSSWWQWRNVVARVTAEQALKNYAMYVPTIHDRGNTDPLEAARPIADMIEAAIFQPDRTVSKPFDVIIIGTSMGARIAAHVEILLAERCQNSRQCGNAWVEKFVFASVAGFFGPATSAQFAARLGLSSTWVGYHPSAAEAAARQEPHDALLCEWASARSTWRSAHYHFFASSGDELLPVTSTVPLPHIAHTVVPSVDHAGTVDGLAEHYIPWIVSVVSDAPPPAQ